MQIKAVVLYNKSGDSRWLEFRLGEVNIITGLSGRGKSGLIDIIDYCMGRSKYSVFEGINRGIVSWYAVVLAVGDSEIFIAKPQPKIGANSQSAAYLDIGNFSEAVPYDQLVLNANDQAIIERLSSLVGFDSDITIQAEGSSKDNFEVSIKHSKFFLFQEHGEIANKRILFHRQAEEGIAQGIRDAFPVIIGSTPNGYLGIIEELRSQKRDLKILEKKIYENSQIANTDSKFAENLIEEAIQIGILTGEDRDDTNSAPQREILNRILAWQPSDPTIPSEDRITRQANELNVLHEQLEIALKDKEEVSNYLRHFSAFSDSQEIKKTRLESIGLLGDSDTEMTCPVCGNESHGTVEFLESSRAALERLNTRLMNVDDEKPALEKYITKLESTITKMRGEIRKKQEILSSLVSQQEDTKRLREANLKASQVVGKVALYMDATKDSGDEENSLEKRRDGLIDRIDFLEKMIDTEVIKERTESILANINSRISKYAGDFGHEYSGHPFSLDINNLTTRVHALHQTIPMFRMGSSKNYLACHLATFLSLHEYFIKAKRPVPNFIIFDQPSQVYFPSKLDYLNIADKQDRDKVTDPDIEAVRQMFETLFEACKKLNNQLQIIVLEHANLPEPKFQEAIVEEPWAGAGGLIPERWLQ